MALTSATIQIGSEDPPILNGWLRLFQKTPPKIHNRRIGDWRVLRSILDRSRYGLIQIIIN